jgi:hypothetical protein
MWFSPSGCNTLCPRENGVVLPKPDLTRVSLGIFFDPCEVTFTRVFYSSSSASYNEFQGPTCGLETGKTLWVGRQWPGVANNIFNGVSTSGLVAYFTTLSQQHGAVLLHRCAL